MRTTVTTVIIHKRWVKINKSIEENEQLNSLKMLIEA